MCNKFLGTGEAGYHPLRKFRTVCSGLRFAALHDFSVAYKLVFSTVLVFAAFWLREWVDVLLILFATALVLITEIMNTRDRGTVQFRRDAPQREDTGDQGRRRSGGGHQHCCVGGDRRGRVCPIVAATARMSYGRLGNCNALTSSVRPTEAPW